LYGTLILWCFLVLFGEFCDICQSGNLEQRSRFKLSRAVLTSFNQVGGRQLTKIENFLRVFELIKYIKIPILCLWMLKVSFIEWKVHLLGPILKWPALKDGASRARICEALDSLFRGLNFFLLFFYNCNVTVLIGIFVLLL
jgi:hypothetical protein